MKISPILMRNTVALILLMSGIYLSLCSIIALPLLEEEASYKTEDFYKLNEEIDKQKDQTLLYLKDIAIDSNTRIKYDSVAVLLGNHSKSEAIAVRFAGAKKQIEEKVKGEAEHCKQLYANAGVMGKIKKDEYAGQLVLSYSNFCMATKQQVFNSFQAVDIQTANLFSIANNDTSVNRRLSRKLKHEFTNLYALFTPLELKTPEKSERTGIGFFLLAEWALEARSQNLAIIVGLMGFALFGAVLGAFGKPGFNNVNADKTRTDGLIYYEILVVLVRGFSAALVVYLSIKGGLSLITTTSSDKINPYVILFLCFISAVFSDNIWYWARTKLVTGDPKNGPDDTKGGGGAAGANGAKDPNGAANAGAEIPAESPDPAAGAAANQPAPAVPPVADLPEVLLKAAIAAKYPEWKEVFSLTDISIGKKVQADKTEVNAIIFHIAKVHLTDPLYCSELPATVAYAAADGQSYNIPIGTLEV